ncbi:MAG: hypothetical protein ACI9XR_000714 [Flavobacterium sp.]|jgi:hypothetical protein
MKKVFLSLAFVAALTVVSCKQADANADASTEAVDSTVVEAPVMESDSATTALDSATTEAPATEEAPKAE